MAFIPSSGSVAAWLQSDNASVITVGQGSIATVIIGGSIAASFTPPANQSVSGTVGASIIGLPPVNVTNFPTNQNVSGSVVAFPVGNQSVSGTVGASIIGNVPVVVQSSVAVAIISGSIAATFTPPANQSVSGTVQTDVRSSVAVVIIGGSVATATTNSSVMLLNGANTIGSVTALQGTNPYVMTGSVQGTMSVLGTVPVTQATASNPWIVTGSVQGSFSPSGNQSVSGTVQTQVQASVAVVIIGGSILTSSTANQSVSGTVGASIIGLVPVQLSSGSVIAVPTGNQSVSGTVNVASLIAIPAIVSTANSTTTPVTSTLSFTGTGEEWKDFASIVINVFTDAVSATNGLSIQQSSDNSNWDITDVYTIPSMAAGQGKTFQVQPAARFGRIVYTQGAQNSGVLRLQTVYHPQFVRAASQRAADAYTNETDLDQAQGFNMVFNGTTWDRMRGTSTNGTLVYGSILTVGNASVSGTVGASIIGQLPAGTAVLGSIMALQGTNPWIETFSNSSILAVPVGSIVTVLQSSSILAVPVGSVITVLQAASIVGTYAEDAASASGDKGFLVMGARNDTLSSVTSNDGDYSSHVVGPAGELIAENAPLTKWVSGTASMLGGVPMTTSVTVIAAQGTSIFTYITGVQVANLGSASVLVSFGGATSSLIGYTIAPAGGGSNIYYQNGIKTSANAAFSASVSGAASIYVSAQGFISKT